MGNYIGYFKSVDDKVLYSVKLIGDTASTSFTEIKLAGESPFVVTWDTSETPFEPIRTSTATISIVHNTYLEDILTSKAQGTIVELYSSTNAATQVLEWKGYLTPKIYDQSYVTEFENIELEAADCLSSLQYVDYDIENRGFVTFKTIIDSACTKSGCEAYYWPLTKKVGGTARLPINFGVSSQNFYTNDTDEPWTYYEVLEEIARYFGMTVYQMDSSLVFNDFTSYREGKTPFQKFSKATSYGAGTTGNFGTNIKITSSSYKASDASITFCPVYNKFYVKDNMYNCEDLFTGIFDDNNLTNRNGDFYNSFELTTEEPDKAKYPWKGKNKEEDVADSDYKYFYRLYDHDKFESVYYTPSYNTAILGSDKNTSACTRNYIGATILDLGVVAKKKWDEEVWQWITPSSVDYTRYLCISQKGKAQDSSKPVFKLKKTFIPNCCVSQNACLVLSYDVIYEKHVNRPYINPDWSTNTTEAPGLWSFKSGGAHQSPAQMNFMLKVGDKYWGGQNTKWVRTARMFSVEAESKDGDEYALVNQSATVLNTVSWEQALGEEGYCIPLEGADISQGIDFQIFLPTRQMYYWGKDGVHKYDVNQYCWVKSLSLKLCEKGQDTEREDEDVVYENVIDEDSINEFNDITFKLTTYSEQTNPSYSHVLYTTDSGDSYTFLTGITESALSNVSQRPEENCIERYSNQYSTPTKRLTLPIETLPLPSKKFISQGMIITNCDVSDLSKKFVILGGEWDYINNKATITVEEIK